jgi:putative peptide zinc metalloprotease protein
MLNESDQICQIGDPQQFEAVLVIDQNDIDLLAEYEGRQGELPEVEMKLDAYRWDSLLGQIDKIASAPMEVSPVSLSAQSGGELNTKMDESGALRPMSTSYQARVPLEKIDRRLRVGLTGRAKVYTGWQPIGRRLARFIYRTFHFDL